MMPERFHELLSELDSVTVWYRLLAVAVAIGLAYVLASRLRARFPGAKVMLGERTQDGVLFPVIALALAELVRQVLDRDGPTPVFRIVMAALVALVVIRVVARVLAVAFPTAAWVRWVERTVSWVAWVGWVLWITGFLPDMLAAMEDVRWSFGKGTMSLRQLLDGLLSVSVVLVLTLWLSSVVEQRLLKNVAGQRDLSGRKIAANTVRVLLLFVGFIVALSSVGIDLSSLAILGSAVGVGIGFGLQKLASNYVSGFVILAERSVRIGDVVRVDGFQGKVTDINTRYTVINDGGREALVPNDTFISSRVENLTSSDERITLNTVIVVGGDSDPDLVARLLVQAAAACPRVLGTPAPTAYLSAFAADGLEFTLSYVIGDLLNGQLNARGEVNIAILRLLREHGVDIPYAQRVVHLENLQPLAAALQAETGAAPAIPAERT
ncbi:MAG: Mechanosensitive channel MscK [Paracidovorax wautersii]|uniref:Mechanosensitive channel MscK n=1 Tax=Paracidovorax wautersii TaxID=1177982 RepID=A0A7V8JPB4_9BURK|nr:MAG: Mechanosensitive channel MscK [Paracidovorax wautersii]